MTFKLTETSAFEQFKPLADAIEAKMIERQTRLYDRYVSEYGDVYPSRRDLTQGYSDTEQGRAFYPCQGYVTADNSDYKGYAGKVMSLDTDRLNKHAKELGESSVMGFVSKLIGKLGNIELRDLNFQDGADFTIWADLGGQTVRVDQQTVYKVSRNNTLYCQFPARIYVDGKFTPASKFDDAIKAAA